MPTKVSGKINDSIITRFVRPIAGGRRRQGGKANRSGKVEDMALVVIIDDDSSVCRLLETLVAQADGGTLFLDEIGEMPLSLQKTFLRVLETRRFRPIGSKEERQSNFRIVASTNRDLDDMVRKGRFRQDLLYRLRTFHLHLPALRARREDIPLLANHHLRRLNNLYGGLEKQLSSDLLDLLDRHDWPGNVRELVNTIDSALSAARDEGVLYSCHLPAALRARVTRKRIAGHHLPDPAAPAPVAAQPLPPLQAFREQAIEKAETHYLTTLLSNAQGSMTHACAMAGVSRSRLYELMKKHAITAG
jgi:two-component system NtrC family response regulator